MWDQKQLGAGGEHAEAQGHVLHIVRSEHPAGGDKLLASLNF
jgi:hypothetical protein